MPDREHPAIITMNKRVRIIQLVDIERICNPSFHREYLCVLFFYDGEIHEVENDVMHSIVWRSRPGFE